MKWMDKFSEKVLPLANKLGNNRYLLVLRDAFMLAFPVTMFGSIVVVLTNLPFLNDGIKGLLAQWFGNGQNATMAIMSLFVTFGIGYYLAKSYDEDGAFGGVMSLASFLILTPFTAELNGKTINGVLSLDRLGAKGMFVAMICGFVATEIYVRISKRGWTIKMPEAVPPAVSRSFSAIIPGFITLSIFLMTNAIFIGALHTNMQDVIYTFIQKPLVGLGSGLIPTLIAIFFIQILWFFGLHGQIIINSVMDPIWNTLNLDNLQAFKAGDPMPHVVNKAFMETFTVSLGGTGMTLAVVIALAFFLKSKQSKSIGRLALAPGIFNVNEPVIFGLPIVMNPMIFIPWLITPMIVTTFNYIVMKLGIVPVCTGVSVPWTVPIGISGMLATNSVLGGVRQLVDFVIVFLIWFPFLKVMDKQLLEQEA